MSKKDISGIECKLVSEDITPWESETISHNGTAREYVIIRVPESSTLRAAIEESGKNYERIVNLKIEGSLNEEDFSFTWYVFIYWKVMGIISRREAFDYNLKYNK